MIMTNEDYNTSQQIMQNNMLIMQNYFKLLELQNKELERKVDNQTKLIQDAIEGQKFNLQIFRKKLNNVPQEEKDKMMQDYRDGKW